VVALATLPLAGCGASTAWPEVQALGARFCAAVMAGDEDAAVALMSAELRQEVAALRAADAGWRARHPGEKPPLGDGLRLAAWQDAPGRCAPEAPGADRVVLAYAPASAPADVWRDTLVVGRQGGRAVITDIRWEPRTGGTLRGWIAQARRDAG
jgi:hypothetical protein